MRGGPDETPHRRAATRPPPTLPPPTARPGEPGRDATLIDLGGTDATIGGDDTGGTVVPPPPSRGGIVTADPPSLFFSYVGAGDVMNETVRISNLSEASVILLNAEFITSDPGFVLYDDPVNRTLNPGETHTLGVRFESTSASSAAAEIRITTSEDQVIVIPITAAEKAGGTPEAPPCVFIAPRRIDFGSVARGTPAAPRTVSVENCGSTDIVLSRLDRGSVFLFPTPASFQWTSAPLPLVVAAGATATFDVTYTAGRAGRETGRIDVRTNVPGSETVGVELIAESTPPPIEELDLHMILRWDQDGGSDVDFHFFPVGSSRTSSNACYYANLSPDWGVRGDIIDNPFLDYDDLEGPGPENINVQKLGNGEYEIVVYYYSDTGSGGGGGGGSSVSTNATVEVRSGGTLIGSYGPTRLSRTGDVWTVARLRWPDAVLTEIGTVTR